MKTLARTVPFALVLLLAASCTLSRESVINRTSVGLVAAREAFTAEDERLQMAIVAGAATKPEAEAKLAEHRKGRDAATRAFQVAWSALAVASLDPSDVNLERLSKLASEVVAALNQEGLKQ